MATRKSSKKPVKKQSTSVRLTTVWTDKKFRILTYVLGVVLVLFAVLYLSRSWVRVTVVPKAVSVFHASEVTKAAETELAILGDPLTAMGYKDSEVTHNCTLLSAEGFTEQVYCSYNVHGYMEVPTDEVGKKQIVDTAASVQEQLQANNWNGTFNNESEYASLNKLVSGAANGIDYTPDAFYSKTTNGVSCTFDTNIAFSQPSPAAISSNFNCVKIISVFTSEVDPIEFPQQQQPAVMPEDDKGVTEGL